MHNSLPSNAEMKRRHIAKESHCEMCGDPDETLYHIIFSFTMARRFWMEVKKLHGQRTSSGPRCARHRRLI